MAASSATPLAHRGHPACGGTGLRSPAVIRAWGAGMGVEQVI